MIKKETNNKFTIIGCLLITSSLLLLGWCYIDNYLFILKVQSKANDFINNKQEKTFDVNVDVEEPKELLSQNVVSEYVGVLEIPKINFKSGFYSINNINNDVNKNIEVLSNSTMPDVENSLLVIAGHSGEGKFAFFTNLFELNINDEIYVYYDNFKYKYLVADIYEEQKDGSISIQKNITSLLVLTTCSENDDTKQTVVVSKLVDKIQY